MSKELEAFELLCRFLVEEINTLRHKEIDEDYFYNEKYGVTMTDKKTGEEYKTADIAKGLKALEIIKEKEVNIQEFKSCLEADWDYEMCEKWCNDNYEWEENPPYIHSMKKEEFDLLKEVLL